MTSSEVVVRAEGLAKRFGRTQALDGLSIKVARGEKYGLLGPNGSGKTTFIRAILGLVAPDAGRMKVLGRDVPSPSVSERVGYMPQTPALYEDLTIHENLRFFARLFGDAAGASDRAGSILALLGLEERGRSPVRTLSGGMRQRTSLAAALIHDPELILLDEPTVGVDPELRVSLWTYFDQLNAAGRTFIISTHVMDEAEHCSRVGLLRGGAILAEGSPGELKQAAGADSLEEAYLWHAKKAERR